jgi:catechol 2,3-dioxygenase-like lactoylglutathione lyase family enzyme
MAKRKPRKATRSKAKRSGRAARSSSKKRSSRRRDGGAPGRERRHGARETLRLRALEPTFTVNDIERSLRFYTDVLGFIVIEQMTDGAALQGAVLKAGVCTLGLSQDDWAKGRDRTKGEGMRIWCTTAQDIDKLAKRITGAGGQLDEEPKNQPWGVRSLSVKDPDGFRLTIYRKQSSA